MRSIVADFAASTDGIADSLNRVSRPRCSPKQATVQRRKRHCFKVSPTRHGRTKGKGGSASKVTNGDLTADAVGYQNSQPCALLGSVGRESVADDIQLVQSNPILKATDKLACCDCKKRWQLAILANVGFLIVFGIRCNLGAAKSHMSRDYVDRFGVEHREFNWTTTELGLMESSFFYGYLITQIPAGFFAAKMFGLAIGGASALNILLPMAFRTHSDMAVALVQIAQGLIQGLAYPAMHGVWRYWAPPLERSMLATTAFTGSYAGAVFGLPISAWLVYYMDWSTPFYVYGVAGVVWTVFWFAMTFEKPAYHPTISREEKLYIEEKIGHVSQSHPTVGYGDYVSMCTMALVGILNFQFSTIPWAAILRSKPVYAIIVANFARSWRHARDIIKHCILRRENSMLVSFSFYLLLQNQLTYMRDALSMQINDSGLIAALPHAVMGVVVLFGGRLADHLRANKILSTTAVRKLFNCGGFGAEAFFLLIVAYTKSERTAMLAMVLAVGCSGFAISGFNVNHLDIAPRYAAILMGFSNGIGTLAGLICPFVVETLTSGRHSSTGWVTVFLLASLIHFTGITFYAVYASGELQEWAEPKEEEEASWSKANKTGSAANSYGAVGEGDSIRLEPLPHTAELVAGKVMAHGEYTYQQQPFNAWDTPSPSQYQRYYEQAQNPIVQQRVPPEQSYNQQWDCSLPTAIRNDNYHPQQQQYGDY